ncbi:Helix-turn-helix domain protein [Caprobacter fermentans]|uniref:Helix-turn-helix domain protein n=1 Tax=Caproicibacter fermentans TaxID=2576756 RepID=A0A6N8I364_9FIRM|nr:helix-turn-helix transcriptional regulator [Caproicibacter fermentans]MVB12355.1 Helix-turn-helix domain protein [Caproicibacter fermentans]
MNEIGKRLKALREAKNMSQVDLANILGKSQVAISKYETGNRQLDYEMLNKYAEYFHVSVDYLLGRVNKTNEFYISGNALPDVMKPFLKPNSKTVIAVDDPNVNVTDEDKKNLIEKQLKAINVQDHKDEFSVLLSVLPPNIRNNPMNLYDLYTIIGTKKEYMDALNKLDPDVRTTDEHNNSNDDNNRGHSVVITDSMVNSINETIKGINNIEKMAGLNSEYNIVENGYQLKSSLVNSTLLPTVPQLDKVAKEIINKINNSDLPVEKQIEIFNQLSSSLKQMQSGLTSFMEELESSISNSDESDTRKETKK